MSEDVLADDQSHYEISLTAGQAFVAFVLLLLSLAASFAFGLMIGKGQADDRLVVRKDPSVVTEASVLPRKNPGTIVELGVDADDFKAKTTTGQTTPIASTDTAAPAAAEAPSTEMPAATATVVEARPAASAPAPTPAPAAAVPPAGPAVPFYAQLLSTGDKNTAETLAAKLIDHGFGSAYVERGTNDKGPTYRVRVKFPSETEARASEAKLREFSKEVWITKN